MSWDLSAAPVRPDPKPASEGGVGRPKPVARSRAKTHRSTWRELHARKGGQCRLCPKPYNNLHHLVGKGQGGPNEAWNLVPLCGHGNVDGCHALVEKGDPDALRRLADALTDEEYAGLVLFGGEGIIERLFGVEYRP